MNKETGTVLPQNIVNGRFVHFSADNIDILDQTLDGKDTFHVTPMTAYHFAVLGMKIALSNR